ncbi:hypothetical protein NL108_009528 [Boleophthalmus pectinirostris]|uniref:protein transport protein Sec16B n=1 Tax=Boleophthalmus pectinirostris TaxID=150288 RepID=UPI00242C1F09|nr:protein transport protein Sec16B [Boleophthalmus pectinirostris]KAJ0065401.1 hypothetical protein NL108_009528 [Boleophthalmus pectinirostris]
MEHRGRPRSQMGHPKNRDPRPDYYKYPNQERGQCYPPPDPREWDRSWGHPESHFRPPVTSPVRRDPYAYGPQHYPYGYGWAEQQPPHSRHGYDYSAYGQWDYRDNYGYYQQDYYRGQHQHPDGGQWGQQEPWQREQYQEHAQQKSISTNTEERYDPRKDGSQKYKDDYEDTTNKENEDSNSSYYLGTLESSKASGLSSSSIELSQYINGAEQSELTPLPVPAETEQNHQLSAPLKYSIPHAVVSFGPAGQLLRVCPGFTTQKNVSQVEIHNMEVILSETQEQQEIRKFPGPLTREDLHKVDAIEFAHQMAGACLRDDNLRDKSSAALLWNLLILLCRQNGQIVGSDIAELLVQSSRGVGGGQSDSASLIDFSEGSVAEAPPSEGEDDLLTGLCSSESAQKALKSYTQLLLAGRKKEALESAMSSGLWGHALFLASRMDNRSYTTVLNRFTGQLTANDPLQTLFQLLSGRVPAVATCCGSERWGDWRPHLAVILSNDTSDSAVKQRAIATMGDTLASRGLLHSAHVCYLTAGLPFGAFTQKDDRLVLLGSSHRQSFKDFATNSAIQCTELYEYCLNLGGKYFSIPSFQVYKFLYATRLLDCGLSSQAFHYCEVVGQAILRQNVPMFVLTDLILKVSDRLRHSEVSEVGLSGADQEPGWMTQLRLRHQRLQSGSYSFSEISQEASESTGDYSPVQSPEPELLYYRDTEEISGNDVLDGNQPFAPADCSGVQEWPQNPLTIPPPMTYAPPGQSAAVGQDFTYYNTNTGVLHSPGSSPPESVTRSRSSTLTSTGMVHAHHTYPEIQQPQGQPMNPDLSGQSSPPKQSVQTGTSGGWFSGWFKSTPKDNQPETSQPASPPQTFSTPDVGAPPPPVAMFPPQPSTTTGINPFSRKAGQQLG